MLPCSAKLSDKTFLSSSYQPSVRTHHKTDFWIGFYCRGVCGLGYTWTILVLTFYCFCNNVTCISLMQYFAYLSNGNLNAPYFLSDFFVSVFNNIIYPGHSMQRNDHPSACVTKFVFQHFKLVQLLEEPILQEVILCDRQ